jgi:hypothetical protein
MRKLIIKSLAIFAFLPIISYAQQEFCLDDGFPFGYGIVCVNPWSPSANQDFGINFSSTSCSQLARHENQVIRNGNAFNIYMAVEVGGCPGVPQSPLIFNTMQEGILPGEYTANLYRLAVPNWPPPPFDPSGYELRNTADFTVLGQPSEVEPVPFIGMTGFFIYVALVLSAGVTLLRRRYSMV